MAAYLGFSSTIVGFPVGCVAGVGCDDCGWGCGCERGEIGLYSGRCVGRELAGAGSRGFCVSIILFCIRMAELISE